MAERLTEIGMFIDTPVYKIKNGKKSEAVDKLAHLEDIMEEYDCNNIEELKQKLKLAHNVEILKYDWCDLDKYIFDRLIDKNLELIKDRDTWKRACELASSHISWCPAKQGECDCVKENRDCTNYFYQQAKKENKKVQIHYCRNDETNKILGDIKIKDDFSTTMQNLAKMYADTLKDLDTAEDKDN